MIGMTDFFWTMGPWNWVILAVALFILEVIIPGISLLWFGVAALIIGGVTLALTSFAPEIATGFTWELQLIGFVVLSIVTVFAIRRYSGPEADPSDEPSLNTRALRYVGRTFTVVDPIVDGRGKVQVGDSLWLAEGADMPAGTRVKVVGVNATVLIVERAP